MRDWHKKLINVPASATGSGVTLGIVDVGLLEFVRNGNSTAPNLEPAQYKVAHPSFENNSGSTQTRVFFRKIENGKSTENITIENVDHNVRTHITGVSGIMAGKKKDEIAGIAPDATLINAQEVIEAFTLANIHPVAKKNGTSTFYEKTVRKGLVADDEVPGGTLTPNSEYSKLGADVINFSISWTVSTTSNGQVGNPNKEECKFLLNELFAYGRKGKGTLIFASAGNGVNTNGVMVGEKLDDTNSFLRASNKAVMVAASTIDTSLFYVNPAQYDNNFNQIVETKAQYSNYGENVDICAPSTPIGIPDAGSLGINTATRMYCGELGFDDQYIDIVVESKIGQAELKLQNTKGIFPGQSIDIGKKESFCNEIRYITEVDRTTNKIKLDKDLFFTRNISITSVRLLLFQKKGKRNPDPALNNKLTLLDGSNGIGKGQQIYIYTSDRNTGIYANVVNRNKIHIEVDTNLSVFPLNETLNIIPGQMKMKVESKGKGRYIVTEGDHEGFFSSQLIRIKDKDVICDLTSIDPISKEAQITLYRPEPGVVYTVESLTYGHYKTKFGGTSAASPVVSGVAALVISAKPELNAAEVKHILKQTATKIGGSGYSLVNNLSKINHGYEAHEYFGTGRVNAGAAIAMAQNWANEAKPVMRLWHTADGTPAGTVPDSPDIWIAPISSADTLTPDAQNKYNTLNTTKNQKIYVRVRNEGNRTSFRNTDLRVLVAFTSETSPKFKFPDCWHHDTTSQTMKTVLLNVQELPPIEAGTSKVVTIEWKKLSDMWKDHNPKGELRMFILAHVAPFDGPDVDPNDIRNNKNLTCREIIPTQSTNKAIGANGKVDILNDHNQYELKVESQTTNKKFSFENYNIASADLDTMEFKFSLVNRTTNNVEQDVVFKKINGNWAMNTVPSNGWLQADMNISDSTLYTNYKNALLNYEFNFNNNDKEIRFNVTNA